MSGPFSGFGIHSDLQVESFSTAKDPYYKKIKEILSSDNIMEMDIHMMSCASFAARRPNH